MKGRRLEYTDPQVSAWAQRAESTGQIIANAHYRITEEELARIARENARLMQGRPTTISEEQAFLLAESHIVEKYKQTKRGR